MKRTSTRLALASVGLVILAVLAFGTVQVASGTSLDPALTVAIVVLGGLLVVIFAWLLLYTDERGVL